jgi:type I restriction enzyme S subunit
MPVGHDFEHQDIKPALPNSWRWVRLGDHTTKVGSGITPLGGQIAYLPSGVPLVRSQNVHMNRFARAGLVFISAEQDAEMETSRVYPDDVLLNITGASIGRVCVIPPELCPANVNQHVSIIRCDTSIYPSFLSYYMSAPNFQKFIMNTQAGATRQALTKTLIEEFQIPLPSLDEQKRIAATLNEQMTMMERARAATEAQLDAAKALPAAYLRAAFNSPEAQRWPRRRLGEICHLLPSKSIATDGDTEVCAITTACLTELGFQASGVKLARMWFEDAAECRVSPGEILIARSNTLDLVGRVAMFAGEPEDAVASDLTIRILPSNSVYSRFLTAYLSLLYLSGYWKERAGGASGSMKKITRSQIQAEQLPTPSLSEQRRIAEALNEQMGAVESMCKALEAQLDAINKLPAALLRLAFRGELG